MIDISVQNIKKAFEEGVDILDDITFEVNEGERIGLLGKNGAGKTTLLKIITGELSEDEGNIIIPAGKVVGMISQIPVFPADYTAEDVLQTAFSRLYAIKTEMEQLEEQMQSDNASEILRSYDFLAFEFDRLGGYMIETELGRVVNGLQIPHRQREQLFNTLSGGEKTRINLARLILEKTDILLLDEPTNHLDLNATMWLEEFLLKFKGTVLIISHDRYFLDKTIHRAIEINNGKAEFYSGNYSYYVVEKKRRFEEQLEKFKREQAESKRLHASADRLHQWGIGNSTLMKKSFALRTRAERAVKTDRPDKDKKMHARFSERDFRGDEVLVIKGLTKSFNHKNHPIRDRLLIDIDELFVQGGERIAIIGDNGTGKTTLVRIIMGQEKPDSGFSRRGPAVKPAYLPQIITFDNPNRSILDTLIYEQNENPQTARNRLGAYLFPGEDVFKLVGDLSGGEKSRLRLCMLMNSEINLLILDEPTNHLDLDSREWIENAVSQYDETLLFISHDRYFINRFATRIWELDNGDFTDFQGTYEKYVAWKRDKVQNKGTVPIPIRATGSEKSVQRMGSLSGKDKKQESKARYYGKPKVKPSDAQKEQRRLEREIEKLEEEIEVLDKLKTEHATDYERLMELDEEEAALKTQLDELLEDWEEVASSLSACEGRK
ncbi:MAG: ABC-F family ATP-binding cassette domain-containing protein [Oscillospiraceae bacterium]|nr:ABC-F family ATP-binding cassette domain-containing protein [Oscillospiraceae bacterium]